MNKNFAYRISSRSISVMLNNTPKVIPSSHMNFNEILEELKKPEHDTKRIAELADIPTAIKLATNGRVTVFDGEVQLDGEECHNYLATRILDHVRQSLPIDPLARFLELLYDNPNTEIRKDLFAWLEEGDMPVTEEGHIVGYKYVRDDYRSSRAGKDGEHPLHAVGTFVEMPRSECDEDRNRTCSTGLHFCSFKYLPMGYYSNSRIMIVKINPKDVTAIPVDYDNQKARCCRYEVIGEITGDVKDHYRGQRVVNEDAEVEGVDTSAKKKVEEDRLEKTELTRNDIKTLLKGMKFSHAKLGKSFTAYQIWNGVNKMGQRQFSDKTGIPRSTMQGWLYVIEREIKNG